jgi:hypothetical protein
VTARPYVVCGQEVPLGSLYIVGYPYDPGSTLFDAFLSVALVISPIAFCRFAEIL